VLLTVAFAGMLVLVTCLFAAARAASGASYADAAFQAAGRSVLSEYDTELLGRYGLFSFKGDERRIERDIRFYADASLRKDKRAYLPFVPGGKRTRVFDIKTDSTQANLKEFSLLDVNNFERQLKSAAAAKTASKLVGGGRGGSGGSGGSGGKDYSDPLSGHPDRKLRNEGVIAGLPSADVEWSLPNLSSLSADKLSGLATSAANDVVVSQYILAVFGHANDGVSDDGRFFDAEAEYILSGKTGDRACYNSVKLKLVAMRMIANNASILRDPVKMRQVVALAAPFAIAAGIGDIAAKLAIIELWAAAETENDIDLFEAGRKVAIVKTPAQWALTNLMDVAEGVFDGRLILPRDRSGQTYEDYLRVLLFIMDRETKLLRVMDLIQIDMKANYDRDFLVREYYTGFRVSAEAGGETFDYTERYDEK
jgi:hypothetical protein